MWRAKRRAMQKLTSVASALSFASLLAFGCSDTVDEVHNSIDCHSVCSRYADCFDNSYDVDGCTDRCKGSADSDEQRQSRLRACDDCIDERSCTSATFNCAANCSGIVP
jgi:hypothetical protein